MAENNAVDLVFEEAENCVEIFGKSHLSEHFVGFIQYDDLHLLQLHGMAPDMIQGAPRRGDERYRRRVSGSGAAVQWLGRRKWPARSNAVPFRSDGRPPPLGRLTPGSAPESAPRDARVASCGQCAGAAAR